MWKRMFVMLVCVSGFVAGIAFWKEQTVKAAIAMGAKFGQPPVSVTTVVAQPQRWEPVLNAVGSLKAVNGVTVTSDLPGIVSEILFESGATARKGQILVKLDTRQEEATLKSAEAKRDWTKVSLSRQKDLLAKKAASQSEYDSADSEFRQAEAAVDDARVQISRKTIPAPFDGLIGIRQVNVGQYLNAGNAIVSLQSLDPIYVEFSVPQQDLDRVSTGKKLRVRGDGLQGAEFSGEITAVDSQVDATTRNISVQGTIPNPEGRLRPGMFVNVDVVLPEQASVITVPATAISYAPYGDSVFVVKESKNAAGQPMKTVEQRFVKLGPSRGDQVSVVSGVNPGDEVVSSGVFKLESGAAVQVNNVVHPSNEAKPTPPET